MVNQYAEHGPNAQPRDPRTQSMHDIAGNLAAVSQLMGNIRSRLAGIRAEMHTPLEALALTPAALAGGGATGSRDGSGNSQASLTGVPPGRASIGARSMARQQSAALRDGAAGGGEGGRRASGLGRQSSVAMGRQSSVAMGRQSSVAMGRQQSMGLREAPGGCSQALSSFAEDRGGRSRKGADAALAQTRTRFLKLRDQGRGAGSTDDHDVDLAGCPGRSDM